MNLSRYTLKNISSEGLTMPEETVFELPEKVLQFGTGVLLRGLPDYFIDKANRQGLFNGRIVVVKSTTHGDTTAFDRQDGLYTLCVRGLYDGKKVEENIINSSVSRVLDANSEWKQVLECAHNRSMQIIISNTTEVGIQLVHDDILRHPPVSYPGKLLAFLYERYTAFEGSERSGMVIVPTELIPDNGKKLEAIVLELAHLNGLEIGFIEWLENCNHFCNSLVDRIVPGSPDAAQKEAVESALGYNDNLLVMSEVYRLWAIEGDQQVREVLTFAGADEGVVITPNIDSYRELKLRLLNGTHTFSCGLAFLTGNDTVQQAVENEPTLSWIQELMQGEIARSIPYEVEQELVQRFSAQVLDRFRNPHIRHQWINITVQYSSKMKMRCIPLILRYYELNGCPPPAMALGFAAYLLFMKAVSKKGTEYFGEYNGQPYPIKDDAAESFYKRWSALSVPALVKEVLADSALWGTDLSSLPGFYEAVLEAVLGLINEGALEYLGSVSTKKEVTA